MLSTKLIRDHHLWTKNINNISGDLRITIDDVLNFVADAVVIDTNINSATAAINKAFHVDMDKTGDISTGLDSNTAMLTNLNVTGASGGFITNVGHSIMVVGDTGGSSTNTGLNVNVSGADVNNGISITTVNTHLLMAHDLSSSASIAVANDSHLTIATAESGNIILDPAGALNVSGADVLIDSTKKLYLDGGGDTYIHEVSGDRLTFAVGGDAILDIIEDTTGNKITAKDACIGFDQVIYSNSANILFNDEGNKAELTLTADITNLRMYFPNVSCNCVLVIKQDGTGSHAISNWLSLDESDGNQATIYWAGGTAPTVTTAANSIDIISFYWDNDGHKCYGVASQAFAQP